ncbi:MAG TPA: nitrous oxide reductase accessory protein NosL [Flavisolibacter sp.]|nr:nitrous oxide reductase accessory protein NosL [Flavisolibacter sp.]
MKKMSIPSRLFIAIASLGMISVFFLPVWFIFLTAPQYPEGLEMNIWLTKITGQVDIINGLNHYIGMKHISVDMFPEFGYMKYILGAYIVYGLLVALIGTRSILLSLLIVTLVMAGAALYDFYQWGYDYGHNLDPDAAIKVPGLTYQPPVIGHKTLLNFDAYSYPDTGGWIVTIAAAIFFGVYFFEWYKARKSTRQNINIPTSKVAIAACIVFLFSSCSAKPEPIVLGKDACEDCRMTIMEPRFGAEIITTKGRIFKFDDAHCVDNYIQKGKIAEGNIKQTLFVDYNNPASFVEGANVFFVTSPQLKSPMNSNSAAFASKDEADKKAAETGGKVSNWTSLRQSL